MTRRRCCADGCRRFASPDSAYCSAHHELAEPGADDATSRAATFARKLADGSYRQLFGPQLALVMGEAAAVEGVGDEIGALRFVLAKALQEESDPEKLARIVARVAAVSIQAARVQRAITGGVAESLTEAITQVLVELDGP